jgi:hypothetical protein
VVCNGSLIVDYIDDAGLDAPSRHRTGGPIGLQLHSNSVPSQVEFKEILVETNPGSELLTMIDSG